MMLIEFTQCRTDAKGPGNNWGLCIHGYPFDPVIFYIHFHGTSPAGAKIAGGEFDFHIRHRSFPLISANKKAPDVSGLTRRFICCLVESFLKEFMHG
jgi:hypothetical protein